MVRGRAGPDEGPDVEPARAGHDLWADACEKGLGARGAARVTRGAGRGSCSWDGGKEDGLEVGGGGGQEEEAVWRKVWTDGSERAGKETERGTRRVTEARREGRTGRPGLINWRRRRSRSRPNFIPVTSTHTHVPIHAAGSLCGVSHRRVPPFAVGLRCPGAAAGLAAAGHPCTEALRAIRVQRRMILMNPGRPRGRPCIRASRPASLYARCHEAAGRADGTQGVGRGGQMGGDRGGGGR